MKDVCFICGKTGKYGSMESANKNKWHKYCDKCKDHRCSNCNFLRSSMKSGHKRYFCKHSGVMSNPKEKVCTFWNKQSKNYSTSATIKDYGHIRIRTLRPLKITN